MAATAIDGYQGPPLGVTVRAFVEYLMSRGFDVQATGQYAGKTLRVLRDGKWLGYINGSVLERNGVLGFRFTSWDHDNNACPPGLSADLERSFASRYECMKDDFVLQEGKGANAGRVFLIIKNPTVALQVLQVDAGVQIEPQSHLVEVDGSFVEGLTREVTLRHIERSAAARQACLQYHGFSCAACGETLRQKYRGLPVHIIHVHHEEPLSSVEGSRSVDPRRDLKPVCPNCHAVIHSRTPPYSVIDVAAMVRGETKKLPEEGSRS